MPFRELMPLPTANYAVAVRVRHGIANLDVGDVASFHGLRGV
eukprot:CAMPEP_0182911864 /NCGR_PEP_ID=MMETSP0034_2-20130328/37199_1 /TAXON_ID=156128 /ORGANISM="Nephroselmis pyriformis, Strain CCMP717" /LENGTH=41 /DNA_ID= /DNA_START= /DNA_END= /DNA_ORIENTATION=